MKIRIKKSVFWKNYVVKYIYEKSVKRKLGRKSIMKRIMFGNSLMLLGVAIMILAGL